LKLRSGESLIYRRLDGHDSEAWRTESELPRRTAGKRLPGILPDILSASEDRIFAGWTCFDAEGELRGDTAPHLFSATGFLDESWWHRTYWQYGTWMRGGFGGWPQAARQTPAGRLLVLSDNAIFGFGREKYDAGNPKAVHAGHVGVIKDGYQDSGRVAHDQNPYRLFSATIPDPTSAARRKRTGPRYHWRTSVPILVRAMLLADGTLWISGPKAKQNHQGLAELATTRPGQLRAVLAADGSALAHYELDADPVLDGLAAIPGHLFVSCTDGTVRCFADRSREK
jgi:hypothetical protein